ncbi:MAG: hypothetical protein ACQR33_06220 [Candidatus Saccharibacteria bacterium]
MQGSKKFVPLAIFATLALAVLLPLLNPGFVLTLDMVFTPKMPMPTSIESSYPLYALLHFLSVIMPIMIVQKVMLFAILFGSALGAYRLVAFLQSDSQTTEIQWAACFAGVTYVFNPFVYSRFMAGQFALLLGYMLLPFFIRAVIQFCRDPERRSGFWVCVWLLLINVASLHIGGLAMLAGATVYMWQAVAQSKDARWRRNMLRWGSAVLGIMVAVSLYWIVPVLVGKSQTLHAVRSFNASDLQAFATGGRGWGLIGNVLSLQGFWGDAQNLYSLPRETFVWWWLPIVLLWGVICVGIVRSWRRERSITSVFLALIGTSTILAIGSAGTIFAPFNRWIALHVPLFIGYREPQKFVVLIALGFAWFAGEGFAAIVASLQKNKQLKQHVVTLGFLLFLIPILTAPMMTWGFHGQLKASEYPVEWDAMNDRLHAACTGNCQILYLPWHLYMRYDFAGRIIGDPTPRFFTAKIIASDNPEIKQASSYDMTTIQRAVQDQILPAASTNSAQFGELLNTYHIRYILLAKENDYHRYGYLDKDKTLQMVFDRPTLRLYEVKK